MADVHGGSRPQFGGILKVVVDAVTGPIGFDPALDNARMRRALRAEARAFAAINGPNAYSDFVIQHGRRPDPDHAAALGRAIGKQVKASDGRLYPRLTRRQREARRAHRQRRKEEHDRRQDIARFKSAIENLRLCASRENSSLTLDESDICPFDLESVRLWLAQFAGGYSRGREHQADNRAPLRTSGDGPRSRG